MLLLEKPAVLVIKNIKLKAEITSFFQKNAAVFNNNKINSKKSAVCCFQAALTIRTDDFTGYFLMNNHKLFRIIKISGGHFINVITGEIIFGI